MKCLDDIKEKNCQCENKQCRYWINYNKDQNCSYVSIEKYGKLDLFEVGKRLDITAARVQQIEIEALKKLSKRLPNKLRMDKQTILEE